MAVTASPRLWLYLRENPPTLLVGGLEFIIGGILFTSLFRYLVRVFSALKGQNGQSLSYCDSVALSCKVVSAIFACVSCAMGIIVLRDCGCISFSVYNAIPRHYMSFGLSYFFYDIYAMYVVFKENESEETESSFTVLKNFVRARVLLVGHHLFLPFFIYPVFMGGLQSFGGGDCLVAAGFLLEASTPFVSLRKILAILGLKKSNWYIINGLVMTLVFFACRVIFFPVVYYLYSVEHGASMFDTITKHVPPICSISMLVLFLPQLYWFGIMLKGGLKVICGKDTTKDD